MTYVGDRIDTWADNIQEKLDTKNFEWMELEPLFDEPNALI